MTLPDFSTGDLFRISNSDGQRFNACVGDNGGPYGYDAYAHGYLNGGNGLLRQLLDDPTDIDNLIYPLCYLYRQGFELAIKHLIYQMAYMNSDEAEPNLNHDIDTNWTSLRRLLVCQQQHFPGEARIENTTLEWTDRVLADFTRVDAGSFTFRYPTTRNGCLSIHDLSHINIVNFGRYMEPLSEWFSDLLTISNQMVYDAS